MELPVLPFPIIGKLGQALTELSEVTATMIMVLLDQSLQGTTKLNECNMKCLTLVTINRAAV